MQWKMRNKMIIEYEQYYCKSCGKLFNDVVHNSYYTRNDFCDNQVHLIYNLKYNRKVTPTNFHSQCPYCHSVHNVKTKPIIELMNRDDNKGCNQYTKGQFKLYKRIMAKLEQQNP